jgi:iron complex transport system substrate-binding protein
VRRTLLAVAVALAVGCGTGRVDDAAPKIPQRIVSMAPALTEILFALGVGDRVVGVTTYCDYPPEARQREKIGGFVNPSVEAIIALTPDLVLVSPAAGNRDAALAVRAAGVRLEIVPAESLTDTYDAIRTVAVLCGVRERGEALEHAIRERIERVSARVAAAPRVPALFCLQVDPLIAAGRGTLPAELMELAGAINVVEAERYPVVGIESILARAPAVILQTRMDTSDPSADAATVEYWNHWTSIPAVRDGRVLVFDGTSSLRAGPRVADAVELLAQALHPELPA